MRLYALLLLLYPREIRDRFGAGMRYAFRRDSDAARAQGLGARLAFWLTTLVESVRFGLAERLESRPHPQKQEGTEMTSAWTIDWRDAWRALRATPLVTALAVLSLALGIGANTALFSILNSPPQRSPSTETWEKPLGGEIPHRGDSGWRIRLVERTLRSLLQRGDRPHRRRSGRTRDPGRPPQRTSRGGGPDGIDIGIEPHWEGALAPTRQAAMSSFFGGLAPLFCQPPFGVRFA